MSFNASAAQSWVPDRRLRVMEEAQGTSPRCCQSQVSASAIPTLPLNTPPCSVPPHLRWVRRDCCGLSCP